MTLTQTELAIAAKAAWNFPKGHGQDWTYKGRP